MLEVLYEIMLEHLTRIYIVCLEAQRNTGCPEEIQGNGQNDEKCNRIRKHKAAQRTDTGLFVVFLAVNEKANMGVHTLTAESLIRNAA